MRRLLAAAGVAALLLTGCSADVAAPGRARIDVDTPQLRQVKADAHIEDCRPGDGRPVEGGLPDVTLPCLGGGRDVDLSSLRGPMVVSVWASWCGPCRKEMPALGDFYDRYGDEVPVLGIDYQDTQTGPALELASASGVTYPLLADPQGDLAGRSPWPARMPVPSLVFLDADGAATLVPGGVGSAGELAGLVEKQLRVAL